MKKQIFKPWQIFILVLAVIVAVAIIQQGHSPEYFDRFGIVFFSFLAIVSYWMLKTKKETPDWVAFLTFVIAITGLIVDGYVVLGGIK